MKSKKFKLIMALILNIVIGVSISILLSITMQSSARNVIKSGLISQSNSATEIISARLNQMFMGVDSAEVYGTGTINGEEFEFTYNNQAYVGNQNTLIAFDYTRTKNLFTIRLDDGTYLTAMSVVNGAVHNVYLVKESVTSSLLNQIAFNDIILTDNTDRIILAKQAGDKTHLNLPSDTNLQFKNISKGQYVYITNTIGDFGLKATTVTSTSYILKFLNLTLIYGIVYIVLIMVINLSITALLLLAMLKSDIYVSSGIYSLVCDSSGQIISANRRFKKAFNIRTIFEYVYDKNTLPSDLDGGYIVLLLDNVFGKKVAVKLSSKLSGENYKLYGHEITELFSEFETTKKKLNLDMVTGLSHDLQFIEDYEQITLNNIFDTFAVVLLEITNEKALRSMFGNSTAMQLQKLFAKKMTDLFVPQYKIYHSIDEKFIIFAQDSAKTDKILNTLNQAVKKLEEPISIKGNVIKPVVKAGIARVKDQNYKTALMNANIALKHAKLSTNKHSLLYDVRVMKSIVHEYSSKESILALLDSNKFQVYFQPQYSVTENKIIGFEALTRLVGAEFKGVSVQEFIETAEHNGAIIELGERIYSLAMEFAKSIEQSGICISINVSPVQLMQDGFTELFIRKFNSLKLQPGSIAVEITESILMQSYEDIINKLLLFKRVGIHVHLDDFGTSYSSLLHLNKLPLDALKIDREFVFDLLNSNYSKTIVSFMIKLSQNLNIKCIIEGVENIEQLTVLKELEAEIIQGYYISRAVSPKDATELISSYKMEQI